MPTASRRDAVVDLKTSAEPEISPHLERDRPDVAALARDLRFAKWESVQRRAKRLAFDPSLPASVRGAAEQLAEAAGLRRAAGAVAALVNLAQAIDGLPRAA